jgi:hypothetical protein
MATPSSPTATTAQQAATALRLTPALPQAKFGLLRPLVQDQARDFAQASGDALLASRVGQVIGSAGEFPWRPDLNANLDRVRNVADNYALQEFARAYISQALQAFLPSVVAVAVSAAKTNRTLLLTVTCTRLVDLNRVPAKTFTSTVSLSL